ncbi:hypothetical protein BDP27DRAFT_1345223 [Rhodocollybia butyracea]|uniref:Glycoside hydrolase family 76 protein n=1 Tax=Rhodocollybia butyracea TaxID=206335 RepID=A0A9P5P622_9AGAR|nr:hypothetical protein BDP27DRAFT_1345223 [Rhodocollybia butyracea]
MCFLHWLPVLILLISRAVVAEYVVPSSWSSTNITASNEDRQAIIAAAIQEAFTLGTSFNADFYSVLAVSDLYSNTTTYKNQVTGYFATATFQGANNNEGIDAMRAYQVYKDSAMLNLAIQVWEYCRNYTISPANVASGTMPTKSFNVGKTCSGGGACIQSLFVSDVNETTLYGINTALSAYLAQATSNTTYLSAATDSGAFMIDVMQVTSPGNGAASISANASAGCGNIWGAGSYQLEHTGWFMEGLAMLPGSTTLGQQSVSVDTLSVSLIVSIIRSTSYIGKGAGDSTIVQGIGALYHVLQGPADLLTYIGSFLGVQYNTITSAATTPGSNVYANSWIGPPAPFDLGSQTQAVFALVNGAQVDLSSGHNSTASNNGTSGSGSGSNNSGNPNSSNSDTQHKIAFLTLLALALFLLKRRRQTSQNLNIDALEPPQHRPPPTMPSFSTFSNSNSFPVEKPRYSPVPTGEWTPSHGHVRTVGSSGEFGQTGESLTSGALPTPSVAGSGAGSGSGSDADARLEQIPTDNLIQILQSRLQQQGMPEQGHAPPAYEAPR